jgi:archaemetzincin
VPLQFLDDIAKTVHSIFGIPVVLHTRVLDMPKAFDVSRDQYNSSALLSQVVAQDLPEGAKRIAVVDVDLFVPVLTFVFGEAQFDGLAAIVSTHRLDNEFYGMSPNPEMLYRRLEKEIVHELGHTFGLYHCRQFECVMRSSTYVEEIDLKRTSPCPTCGSFLSQARVHITQTDRSSS